MRSSLRVLIDRRDLIVGRPGEVKGERMGWPESGGRKSLQAAGAARNLIIIRGIHPSKTSGWFWLRIKTEYAGPLKFVRKHRRYL